MSKSKINLNIIVASILFLTLMGMLCVAFISQNRFSIAYADGGIPYINRIWDDGDKKIVKDTQYLNVTPKELNNDAFRYEYVSYHWDAGWYVVSGADTNISLELQNSVEIRDVTVNIILLDDAKVTFSRVTIDIFGTGVLNIYGQEADSGKLIVEGYGDSGIYVGENAQLNIFGGQVESIGGASKNKTIYKGSSGINLKGGMNVYGGHVKAKGFNIDAENIGEHENVYSGAGIGGNANVSISESDDMEGELTVYGGEIEAIGYYRAAGIGGGYTGNMQGIVNVKGGIVRATGSDGGAAIGGGYESTFGGGAEMEGSVNITGGEVFLTKVGEYALTASLIGHGKDGSDNGTLNISGDMCVFNEDNIRVYRHQKIEYLQEQNRLSAHIKKCDEHSYFFTCDSENHSGKCKYCAEELSGSHSLNGMGICSVCGYSGDTFTIEFYDSDLNNPDGYQTVLVPQGSEYQLPMGFISFEDKSIDYWELGDEKYQPGDIIIVTSDIALTEYWKDHVLVHYAAKDATCTEVGWNEYDECTKCDYTTKEEIQALGHSSGEWEQTLAPTCSDLGSEHRLCDRCGEEEIRDIAALGHDLIHHGAKEATCLEAGWEEYDTCSRCDYTTYEEIQALGHNIVHHDAKAATCLDIGWDQYDACLRCDYTTYEETPALGHEYHAEIVPPTCTIRGYTIHACSRCGDSYLDNHVDATGHNYGEWHVTKEPQIGIVGEETRICSICEEKETRKIASLPYVPQQTDDGQSVFIEEVTQEAKDVTELFKQAKEQDGVVEIKALDDLVITFDNDAVKAIGDAAVSISAKVTTESISIENAELVLEVVVDGAAFESGKAIVSIPFTKEVPEGKVAKVYFIDNNGTKVDMDASFENGKVTFATNHFSTYAVIFEDVQNAKEETINITTIIIVVAIGIAAIVCCVVIYALYQKGIIKRKIKDRVD